MPLSPANADLAPGSRCDKQSCLLVRVSTDSSQQGWGVKQGQGSLESQGQRCTSTPLGLIQNATLRGCPSPRNTGQGHWDLAVPSEPSALSISNSIKCKDVSATLEAAEVDRAQLSWGSLVVVCRGPHLFVSVHAVALYVLVSYYFLDE